MFTNYFLDSSLFPHLPRLAFGSHHAGREACQFLLLCDRAIDPPAPVGKAFALHLHEQREMATLGVRNRRKAPRLCPVKRTRGPLGSHRLGQGRACVAPPRGPPAQHSSAAVSGSAKLAGSRCAHKTVRTFRTSECSDRNQRNPPGQKQRRIRLASPFELYCNSPRSSSKGAASTC